MKPHQLPPQPPSAPPFPYPTVTITLTPGMLTATQKFRKAHRRRGGSELRQLDAAGIMMVITQIAAAHVEQIEAMCFQVGKYCADEGVGVNEYLDRLMRQPLPKKV